MINIDVAVMVLVLALRIESVYIFSKKNGSAHNGSGIDATSGHWARLERNVHVGHDWP